jgi:hypothetical protein
MAIKPLYGYLQNRRIEITNIGDKNKAEGPANTGRPFGFIFNN